MNNVLLITLLLIVGSRFLTAQQTAPVQYKMETGDDLYYKLEIKDVKLKQQSATYWLHFQVKEKLENEYRMVMRFSKIFERTGDVSYNSSDYFPGESYNLTHQVTQQAIDQDIFFTLSKRGEISNILFSEELQTALKQNILGIRNKNNLRKRSLLSEARLKSTIRMAFPYLAGSKTEKSWVETIEATTLAPELEMEYQIINASNTEHFIHLEQEYTSPDSASYHLTDNREIIPMSISKNGSLSVDKSTALLNSAMIIRETRVISLSSTNHPPVNYDMRSTLSVSKLPSLTLGKQTTVSGTLPDYGEWAEVNLAIWQDFPDNDLLDVKMIPINNEFRGSFYLDRPTEIALIGESVNGNPANFGSILLQPGDSLDINIDPSGIMEFRGEGSVENDLWQRIKEAGLNLSPGMSIDRIRQIGEDNYTERSALLARAEGIIPEWAIEHMKTDIYFREQRNLYNYYIGNINRSPDPELFQKLFGELDFKSHESSLSFELRWFLNDYLYAQANLIQGYTSEQVVPNSELYTLAGLLLDGQHEYYAKAHFAHEALKMGRPAEYEPIYADFSATYPGSPLLKGLKREYEKRGNIALGELAPDFTLKNLEGEPFQLSDMKGKWVMLVFSDLNKEGYVDDLEVFTQMAKELPDDSFQYVIAFTNRDSLQTVNFLDDKSYQAILLDNHGWKEPATSPYNIHYHARNYLLNPDGELEFIGGANPWQMYISDFVEFIKSDIEERSQIKGSSDKSFPLWIIPVFLGIVTIIWLYFVLKTARLKRIEREKLEKVEMEIKAVRAQLNPHFLYNSMSSIQHLVNSNDNEKANLFLSKFAGLMRKVLNQSDAQLQALAQELETLSDYLELEALRHGFQFNIQIDDAVDVHNTEIPPMLLQPFVENAIVHGISQVKQAGEIDIHIAPSGKEAISIMILDNGIGLSKEILKNPRSNGKGLDLTRKRVNLIMEKFKNEISFILKDRKDFDGQSGALAEIIVGLEN